MSLGGNLVSKTASSVGNGFLETELLEQSLFLPTWKIDLDSNLFVLHAYILFFYF